MIYPPAATTENDTLAASQHRQTRHRRTGEIEGVSVRLGIRIHDVDEADASIDDPATFTTASLE